MIDYDKIDINYDVAYKLDSSFLDFFLYNIRSKTLVVSIKKAGSYYAYNNVSATHVMNFIDAISPGQHFGEYPWGSPIARSSELAATRNVGPDEFVQIATEYLSFSERITDLNIDTVEMTNNTYTLVSRGGTFAFTHFNGELESL